MTDNISINYNVKGSFDEGATLTVVSDVIYDKTTGEHYRWDGVLPKSVPIKSSIELAGGIGIGKWLGIGDAKIALEQKLDKSAVKNELGLSESDVVSQKIVTELGFGIVGSFEEGLTYLPYLTNSKQQVTIENEYGVQAYCWMGKFPKEVPIDSTPESTGGIAKGAWVSVGDASLRSDLNTIHNPIIQSIKVSVFDFGASVSILQFKHLITEKPDLSDQTTWNWTPAFAEASRVLSAENPHPLFAYPQKKRGVPAVIIPMGTYPITQ
ncbi:hypothetical protein M2263_000191 [Providencia alcalifaciens]|nr:hypothetical protein [Providencia alcalifaciens]